MILGEVNISYLIAMILGEVNISYLIAIILGEVNISCKAMSTCLSPTTGCCFLAGLLMGDRPTSPVSVSASSVALRQMSRALRASPETAETLRETSWIASLSNPSMPASRLLTISCENIYQK